MLIDNMVFVVRIEDEVVYLEVYVYEDEVDNLYVYYDVMFFVIFFCVEWMNIKLNENGEVGNFVVVGIMDLDIEFWDLDIVDCMYLSVIFG